MKDLVITLTAPEVHPPQRILLSTGENGRQYAILDGLTPGHDGHLMLSCTLGTWIEDGNGTYLFEDRLPSGWLWRLGWAFADIAREASRIAVTHYDADAEYVNYISRSVWE